MRVFYNDLQQQFERILLKHSFSATKAALCSKIFAANSLDGVYSHGLNRFPVFVDLVKNGLVKPEAEPEVLSETGTLAHLDGHLAPGMYNASFAMEKAVDLAKTNGIGCVSIKNTNHWMRGGTYGWQAADAGCIGICFTNTIANVPPWGGKEPRLGNNPIVIAVPKAAGHMVLDMAVSQYSYGKLQEHELNKQPLPFPGGYDEEGNLTTDAAAIRKTERALPIGLWKGSGLSLMLDIVLTALTGGKSTKEITAAGKESGVSQTFIAIYQPDLHQNLIEQIISFTKSSEADENGGKIWYPGEKTLITRNKNTAEGIPVNEEIWRAVCQL
ncbi:3-dehydro-L-gulonate 2-dehydrogenase [Mucilaginibacter arboris]|uniref:3-dehydro-L-gulonate 2-dehydrogenase n=1 Tax=Mucilaginibacter arboris TaxID=2682090 RepID=A0A7K1SYU9_9SPHI|nr:3-dehydro-L-gulonate 2-dehydrogenase [Mucilaginibacter arboris]MVN22504.1 3-dehydro-L-gulonate 2-dehydrogenase [Mucilaginibacter arboris]